MKGGLPLPRCAAFAGPVASGALVLFSKPYMLGCTPDYNLAADYSLAPGMATPTEATHGTYVDIEPVSGTVLVAHRRLGAHLRLLPTQSWYPIRACTPLVYWVDEWGTISYNQARDLADALAHARAAAGVIIYAVALTLGILFFLLGAAMLIVACKRGYKCGAETAAAGAAGAGAAAAAAPTDDAPADVPAKEAAVAAAA